MKQVVAGILFAIAMLMLCSTAFSQDAGRRGGSDRNEAGQRREGERTDQQPRGQGQRGGGQRGGEPRGGEQRGGGQRGGGQGGGSAIFRLLDTDRDGQLSAKEIDNAVAVLKKLDANEDGTLLAVRWLTFNSMFVS